MGGQSVSSSGGWLSGRIADIPLAGEGEQSGQVGVHMAEGLVQFTM